MQTSFSEFTDSQWQFIDNIINDQRKRNRNGEPSQFKNNRKCYFSLNNGGVQWQNLDSKYPPWQTVFYRSGELSF